MSATLITRRRLIGTAAALGLGMPVAAPRRAAAAAGLIARRTLFENPEYRNVQISPDGRQIAYLAPLDGVRNLWVAALDAPDKGRPLTRAASSRTSAAVRQASVLSPVTGASSTTRLTRPCPSSATGSIRRPAPTPQQECTRASWSSPTRRP